MQADEGVAPVVAVALLIGLVAVAGAIIGLSMFAALEDASGTLPDVRFQASADNQSLYHAGGDALPLKNLVFYDTSTRKSPSLIQLTKNGQTKPETSLEGEVWETGDKITFSDNVLKALSIVGLDSRNHPALLYMGVDAAVLPIGEMVPDEWVEVTPTPVGPVVVPTPVPTGGGEGGNAGEWLGTGQTQKDEVTFGTTGLLDGNILTLKVSYPQPDNEENVIFKLGNAADVGYSRINVTAYDSAWKQVFQKIDGQKNKADISISIPSANLKDGYTVYVVIEMWGKNASDPPTTDSGFRRTVVITIVPKGSS